MASVQSFHFERKQDTVDASRSTSAAHVNETYSESEKSFHSVEASTPLAKAENAFAALSESERAQFMHALLADEQAKVSIEADKRAAQEIATAKQEIEHQLSQQYEQRLHNAIRAQTSDIQQQLQKEWSDKLAPLLASLAQPKVENNEHTANQDSVYFGIRLAEKIIGTSLNDHSVYTQWCENIIRESYAHVQPSLVISEKDKAWLEETSLLDTLTSHISTIDTNTLPRFSFTLTSAAGNSGFSSLEVLKTLTELVEADNRGEAK
ncbi:hypothetical protein OE749_11475 [Aestuariibacter sp. AA17]|uniref:Flagellar assembly protein FliH/Type III secretion system HrpE domain-containing protein n=1 Tax=Fluctibacter corallii TaxID=2984329 RepID=A0ABT3A9K3_9ALTE|nr:hypothetical protein [Aestuariibacter sp. AA17]MCV2885313.1 hypothetical protein [Aestuariibacter sp. AA17]